MRRFTVRRIVRFSVCTHTKQTDGKQVHKKGFKILGDDKSEVILPNFVWENEGGRAMIDTHL